jgi:hypothetical protein
MLTTYCLAFIVLTLGMALILGLFWVLQETVISSSIVFEQHFIMFPHQVMARYEARQR